MIGIGPALRCLIIGMVARAALGHLGRPLRADGDIVVMYAGACRRFAAACWHFCPAGLLKPRHASALHGVLAFAGRNWRFVALADSAAPAASWTLSGSAHQDMSPARVQKICLNRSLKMRLTLMTDYAAAAHACGQQPERLCTISEVAQAYSIPGKS